ncbi:hypothetical protein [Gordonia sp. NPDC003585]|uniref:hypothetical protein n=1 Tax=Gordonia sp. NPDC003585 TaxID=3154275 RepID=UPI0033BF57CA
MPARPATPSKRTTVRVVRAAIAGLLIALGIGLGAFNAWWVALFIGVPLVFLGVAIGPRPSRISELGIFRRGPDRNAVAVHVHALTRSSLATEDLQPTMVSATVTPRDDTEYEARWITSMSKGHFQALTAQPFTTMPPGELPARRSGDDVPEFDDQPGRWAVIYPAVTVVALLALLFGVGQAWHVDAKLPSITKALDLGDEKSDYTSQLRTALETITDEFGQSGADNILSIRLYDTPSSDYATVFDPNTGETTNIWIDAARKSPTTDTRRKPSTFTAAELSSTDLTSVVNTMTRQISRFGGDTEISSIDIERPRNGDTIRPVLINADFDGNTKIGISGVTMQATPDGTVAEFFDPTDFARSFELMRAALLNARIPLDDPVLTQFKIRSFAPGTPYVGSAFNSGGVRVEYRMPTRYGDLEIAPGRFPELTEYEGRNSTDGFAFTDVSLPVFESVRGQAIARGQVPPYDQDAIDIEMHDPPFFDADDAQEAGGPPSQWAISVKIANVAAAEGIYSTQGKFLHDEAF